MPETALYLFCFARSGLLPEPGEICVDDKGPIQVWNFADLAAVLSTVSVEDFCGPEAEARMNDLSWLGGRALRHEAIIERAMVHSPVFPARFGTLFSSLEKLEELLQRHARTISRFLDRVTDHEEWGVKGLLNRERAVEGLRSRHRTREKAGIVDGGLKGIDPSPDSLSPGMRYLQEQRTRAAAEKELPQWLKETCAAVADGLRSCTADFCPRKVTPAAASDVEPVLNWAFLVRGKARAEFRARVERASAELDGCGLTLEITGPWPPYNFVPSLIHQNGALKPM